jgi:hypothetical protein
VLSSFASNAGSDTDDNQNPGCNSPLDNDGGNEAQRPTNFEECWDHDPEIIINENNDSDPILNYSGNTCKLGCVRPSEGISHSSPTHVLKREHTTTRAGRKVIVPSRFIDSVEFNNMGVKCEHCGVEYANRRNLKRHFFTGKLVRGF